MRLNIKHTNKLSKTPKQKKKDSEKKKKGPKISKDYTNTAYYDGDNVILDMTKLKYGIIDSCIVDRMTIINDTTDKQEEEKQKDKQEENKDKQRVIETKNSWLDVIMYMLSTLIDSYPDSFKKLLEENEVTGSNFVVDSVYGKYTFDEMQYKAYNIYDTGYYLELVETSEVIFKAILGLEISLGLQLTDIGFHLLNKNYLDKNVTFESVGELEHIVGPEDSLEYFKNNIPLIAVNIDGNIENIHRLDTTLVAFCNYIADQKGLFVLKSLPSNISTGTKIIDEDDNNNNNVVRIKDSEVGVYTDGDTKCILQFLILSLMYLNLDKNTIQFKFKEIKRNNLKEYEVE